MVPASITAVTAEVPLAFSPKLLQLKKKLLHLKDLNCDLDCTDVYFNPEMVPSPNKKGHTDKVTTTTLVAMNV